LEEISQAMGVLQSHPEEFVGALTRTQPPLIVKQQMEQAQVFLQVS
jgi:hypothetical protein